MVILLVYLLVKNKTTGIQIMTISLGVILVLQYIALLFNLTSSTSPYEFPPQFNPYPKIGSPYPFGEYLVPVFLKNKFLREHANWMHFFSLDIQRSNLNKIWFDFVNLALMTMYFFWYGNPINSNDIKVSFSSTKRLEHALNEYAKIQIERKARIKQAKDFHPLPKSSTTNLE